MFNRIARRYDFLNRFLSLGIDRYWRKRAVALLQQRAHVLDVATGTGDLAIAALRAGARKINGVDVSERMLNIGQEKLKKLNIPFHLIELQSGDAEQLAFPDNIFDAVTVGFGVRNFEHTLQGIREMHRVLKPGGILVVLEFSRPRSFPTKQLYAFYFSVILPLVGQLFSRDKEAYRYLPDSVARFPEREQFVELLSTAGFMDNTFQPMTLGIVTLYTGRKV